MTYTDCGGGDGTADAVLMTTDVAAVCHIYTGGICGCARDGHVGRSL